MHGGGLGGMSEDTKLHYIFSNTRFDMTYIIVHLLLSCTPLDSTSTQGRNWDILYYVLMRFQPFYPGSVKTPENTRLTISGNRNIAQSKTNRATINYDM